MAFPRIAVLVNACAPYFQSTVPPLLASLHGAGVRDCDVYVVVGECEEEHDAEMNIEEINYRVHAYFVGHANIDNNALIWAVGPQGKEVLKEYDWVFMMHDTTMALPEFGTLLPRVLTDLREDETKETASCIQLIWEYSMSMGFYRVKCLNSIADEILATKSTDFSDKARLALKHIVEDQVFKMLLAKFGRKTWFFIKRKCDGVANVESPYGGAHRIRETFAIPGIYKFKANYTNQSPMHVQL